MRLGFRGKTFLAVFAVATAAVLVGALLLAVSVTRQMDQRIERSLVSETRLAAELLSHHQATSEAAIDDEADRIGRQIEARVTFIAADGRVVGDSAVARSALAGLENHGGRPEVVAARSRGLGIARRYSHTLGTDMLYVAVPAQHPLVTVVRLALPLTDVGQQLRAVRQATLLALGVALVSALALAWLSSHLLGRRVNAIAATARAYASGDLTHPTRDYENDEVGTVARVLDDSVRQLAGRMAELAEDRARLEAILTGMLEGVLVLDAHGRLQLANRAARTMLGLAEDASGRPYLESIRHPGVVEILGQALGGRHPDGIEFPAPRSGRTLVARAAPVAAPSATGAVLVLHDVTEMRQSDQVRRDFVANVSHELRTPLTAIRGYVDALGDEPVESAEREQFLTVIARQTGRMERLVKDLLRLASLDAREEPIENEPCALDDLLTSVVRDLSPSIDQKRQRVSVRVDPIVGPITIDVAKLQDALRNIVENASSYSSEGSRIDLSATLESRADSTWGPGPAVGSAGGRDAASRADLRQSLVLRIADEGPGIPESDLERIFERFYRVDKARSRESGGTGLGLSIVKHLVQRLSGDVRAANRPEGGAVFTIRLPYVRSTTVDS
jgi:two-component system phosphate regulon sensor histidine kinase PhoR